MDFVFNLADRVLDWFLYRYRRARYAITAERDYIIETFNTYSSFVISTIFTVISLAMLFGVFSFIIFIVSFISYLRIKAAVVPQSLLSEKLHFDYSNSPPKTRFSLHHVGRQWNADSNQCQSDMMDCLRDQSIMRGGVSYDIMITAVVALADAAVDGSVSSIMTIYDSSNVITAKSSIVLPIPYRSKVTRFLDAVILYPFRLLRFKEAFETADIHQVMIPNFIERSHPYPSTDMIEVELYGTYWYIRDTTITILPHLNGFAYILSNYPWTSAILIISFFACLQYSILALVCVLVAVYYLQRIAVEPT